MNRLGFKQISVQFYNEFVYGGHLLSLGVVSMVFTSAILLDIKITLDFLLIIYLTNYIIYLYNRYKEFKNDYLTNFKRTLYIKKYIRYTPLIIFVFILVILFIFIYFQKFFALYFWLFLIFFGLLYSYFFKKITTNIIGFKSFYVSAMSALLVFFLAFYYFSLINISLILIAIFVFFKCLISTSFYDIKDIKSDRREKLLTFAIILGREKIKWFLYLVSILALLPIIIGVYFKLLPILSLVLFFTIPVSFYFLNKIKRDVKNVAYLSEIAIGVEKISWTFFILLGYFLL